MKCWRSFGRILHWLPSLAAAKSDASIQRRTVFIETPQVAETSLIVSRFSNGGANGSILNKLIGRGAQGFGIIGHQNYLCCGMASQQSSEIMKRVGAWCCYLALLMFLARH
tara:strand:+ start:1282 stop:1614 length:333 start_codon:yes stop_codon:yes gene_type:complete